MREAHDIYGGCMDCPFVDDCLDEAGYTCYDEYGYCPEEFTIEANKEITD